MHMNKLDFHQQARLRRDRLPWVLLVLGLAAFAFSPVNADDPAPHEHTAMHEADFMKHTIDHHHQGIRMAELCTQRATDADLTSLCSTMVSAHQSELEQLQSWLQDWYGEEHQPVLAEAQRDRLTQLESLSEGEFERNFLKDMIPHHMTMIQQAAMCEAQFFHEELIGLCQTSIATQAEEILVMRAELCDSYGICALKVSPNPVADEPRDDTDTDESDGSDG